MKTIQITLLLLFVSSTAFAQIKTDPARKSLLSNEYVRKAESNILIFFYDLKADTTVNFKEIRENALKVAKNDTLLLFSSGSMGYNSRKGVGEYDSITLKYSFLYDDIYTDCMVTETSELAIEIYNTIIEDEISKRFGKE